VGIKAVKFGGTSLSHAEQMKKAAEIVLSDKERRIITVSAPGKRFPQDEKITDLLYRMDGAQTKEEKEKIFSVIRKRLDTMISDLGLHLDFSDEYREISEGNIKGDRLFSMGEYFCAKIFATLLHCHFTDAADVIFLHENGTPDLPKIKNAVQNLMKKQERTVIPGFYGAKPNGEIAVLPRGGSDITGALTAYGADADIYENFTDVNGVQLADPRMVPNTVTVAEISYEELRRLSSMGACVLHADSVLPLMASEIPIFIRNTNDPNGDYTKISAQKRRIAADDCSPIQASLASKQRKRRGRFRIISHSIKKRRNVALSYSGIVGQKGYLLFSVVLREIGKNISDFGNLLRFFESHTKHVYSTPHTVDSVGLLVNKDELNTAQEELVRQLYEDFHAEKVSVTEHIALLSLIGENLSAQSARLILKAMKEVGAEPILLDGGADSLGMTVGFHENFLLPLVKKLHAELVG